MGFIKAVLIFLALMGVGCYAMVVAFFRQGDPRLNKVFSVPFSWIANHIAGVKIEILNLERVNQVRPAVVIGNHQTGLDLAIIGSACPPGSVIVAKKELKKIPIFGWFYVAAGNLLIDRSKPLEARKQMASLVKTLKEKNLNLVVFPEGTRNRGAPGILPFKKGAFYMAVSTGFPLVPVVCSSLKGIAIWEDFEIRGGKVLISVLEPMPTAHLKSEDIEAFQNQVHALMLEEFKRLNLRLGISDRKTKTKENA